ncbi:hypothetical protein TBLA_0B06450 [Henningerozyma blattae CBS 6284]|uniref:Metal homeostatis protein BSD2 n=1 Tax=Henningerozyma blattae (strain ATCC 34711 / CBS 6284 / DSM 70876 / NBRC 10599 / NRRL Y-10934 / UCD 77-7) TaxID=1071380 RepID=I2GZB6_HENB6|nr:hypothetical protein TBLA_0B06450 [Tetrapisispora blattae CBS 6284]CCH59468.1 hypothetical protein TBLA_0B06450 [Tetrapisispora blattae CBS 6284]
MSPLIHHDNTAQGDIETGLLDDQHSTPTSNSVENDNTQNDRIIDSSSSTDIESNRPTSPLNQESIDTASNDTQLNTTQNNGLLSNLRNSAARRIESIGFHFNVLDRVFQRHHNDASSSSAFSALSTDSINDNTANGNEPHRHHHHRHSSANPFFNHGASYDGVFSNLSAKPTSNNENQDGSNDEDQPPCYDDAANDMAPSYYHGTGDGSNLYYDDICIEGLPVGNFANLLWNIIVSTCFQFAGFLITYVLHTSHAAKQGSRLGLGVTFITYAFSMVPNDVTSKVGKYKKIDRIKLNDPMEFDNLHLYSKPTEQDNFESTLGHGLEEEKQKLPLLAVAVALLGSFIIVKGIFDYIKVKRMEARYLAQDQV